MRFRRQHPIGPYIVDFACIRARLIVEVDGATHSTDEERCHDKRRERFLRSHGWHVLRFWNDEIYASPGDAVEFVRATALGRINGRTHRD